MLIYIIPCESYEKFERGECFSCTGETKLGLVGPPILPKFCGKMGYHSDKAPGRGSQYLMTRDGEPFCGGISQFYCSTILIFNFVYST